MFAKRSAMVKAIADTGAQTNLWGLSDFYKAGYHQRDLQSSTIQLSAANKQSIDVVGGFEAEFYGRSPMGEKVSSKGMVYVSN